MEYSKKISILHLITTLDVGGAEMMLLKLLPRMHVDRFKNYVICLAEMGAVGQRISEHGIPVYALNMPRGRVTIRQERLREGLESRSPTTRSELFGSMQGKRLGCPTLGFTT